jgi:polyisoprenyl-phosphate glycosyltransferase
MTLPKYSFIFPIYNEADGIHELFTQTKALIDQLDGPAEVLLVDDGSRDQSFALCLDINKKDPRYRVIHLARNFGHQLAITAGMDLAQGQAIIIMDADLQDPPEVVLEMVKKWKEGYDIVYGVRSSRAGENFFKKLTATAFYRLLSQLSEIDIPPDVGDFRLVDRSALEAFKALRESNRYVRGMFTWIGFKQTGVHYDRNPRFAGSTKYPFRKMLKLARDAIVSFSFLPLRFVLNLGFLISFVAFLAGVWAVYLKISGAYTVQGWTSLAVVISLLGGTQLIVIGILGEYIGRIYEEVKNRPLYIVRSVHGFLSKENSLYDTQLRAILPSRRPEDNLPR